MDLLAALVLGVIQGVAEWLPISSKTQIMFASQVLLGAGPELAYSLGLFLEAASVLAALIYFRGVYLEILRGLLGDAEGRRWLKYVVVTTAVTGAVGIPLYLAAKRYLLLGASAGWLMIALGLAVILNAAILQRARAAAGLKTFGEMPLSHMALVGLAQALSVLPGVSRSGITTTTLLLLGYRPDEAFKSSFVLVPIAGLGATALAYLSEGNAVATPEAATAMAVGLVVSLATIRALLQFAKSRHVALVNIAVGALAIAGGLAKILTP
ncbi:undecaprenyl-diphosphate phosphatase [Pyrobaculum neutrophilum]|uniref:Undecaprenyl-diphosphatase n=1 Tax=Pyrobaculum neutrophilum (strain DSM 2338 / JCM 9278 / NBRC 100436 / V24Sta) TaxID=444157 RepID=B1YBK7_PYRNV|nr:undecaprenyl-diphosphate phosphatase [Pyrobaculum neutrophilum]ACB40809.1 Bacitracin resistance protein BacA [Pyrobaculum neutrophilum V24Sta]